METRCREGTREYCCDGCGDWEKRIWLDRGRLYCHHCLLSRRPAEMWARVLGNLQVAQYVIDRARQLQQARRGAR